MKINSEIGNPFLGRVPLLYSGVMNTTGNEHTMLRKWKPLFEEKETQTPQFLICTLANKFTSI